MRNRYGFKGYVQSDCGAVANKERDKLIQFFLDLPADEDVKKEQFKIIKHPCVHTARPPPDGPNAANADLNNSAFVVEAKRLILINVTPEAFGTNVVDKLKELSDAREAREKKVAAQAEKAAKHAAGSSSGAAGSSSGAAAAPFRQQHLSFGSDGSLRGKSTAPTFAPDCSHLVKCPLIGEAREKEEIEACMLCAITLHSIGQALAESGWKNGVGNKFDAGGYRSNTLTRVLKQVRSEHGTSTAPRQTTSSGTGAAGRAQAASSKAKQAKLA